MNKKLLLPKKIDIILISDAHLTPSSKFRIPGYTTYHCDHPDGTAHVGSAIIMKSNINHTALPHFQTSLLQATNLVLLLNHIPTTISAAYCPPDHANEITTVDFNLYFQTLGNMFLSGRDFNSKHHNWGSRLTNTRDRSLFSVTI